MKEKLSIVDDTWEYVRMWYSRDESRKKINEFLSADDHEQVKELLNSQRFIEWMTREYRHAMGKGAKLAASEIRGALTNEAKRQAEEKLPLGE